MNDNKWCFKVEAINQRELITYFNMYLARSCTFLNTFAVTCESKLSNLHKRLETIDTNLVLLETKVFETKATYALFRINYGSMSITQFYIGSTHINDKKIIDRLSTHYQPFYGFSLIKVFFSNYAFNTHY